jgi:hypothetical protein
MRKADHPQARSKVNGCRHAVQVWALQQWRDGERVRPPHLVDDDIPVAQHSVQEGRGVQVMVVCLPGRPLYPSNWPCRVAITYEMLCCRRKASWESGAVKNCLASRKRCMTDGNLSTRRNGPMPSRSANRPVSAVTAPSVLWSMRNHALQGVGAQPIDHHDPLLHPLSEHDPTTLQSIAAWRPRRTNARDHGRYLTDTHG